MIDQASQHHHPPQAQWRYGNHTTFGVYGFASFACPPDVDLHDPSVVFILPVVEEELQQHVKNLTMNFTSTSLSHCLVYAAIAAAKESDGEAAMNGLAEGARPAVAFPKPLETTETWRLLFHCRTKVHLSPAW